MSRRRLTYSQKVLAARKFALQLTRASSSRCSLLLVYVPTENISISTFPMLATSSFARELASVRAIDRRLASIYCSTSIRFAALHQTGHLPSSLLIDPPRQQEIETAADQETKVAAIASGFRN